MIGLIAILLTAVIIGLVSINMGVIEKFTNSEQSIENKASKKDNNKKRTQMKRNTNKNERIKKKHNTKKTKT